MIRQRIARLEKRHGAGQPVIIMAEQDRDNPDLFKVTGHDELLTEDQVNALVPHEPGGPVRLIMVCREYERAGSDGNRTQAV
jgi:hypothetical protein